MSDFESQDSETPRLTMTGVSKHFGATKALRNVEFSVLPGEVLALVGENGAGKSTLMKILSGAHQPNAGSMTLDGESFQPQNPLAARAAGVAMIYQELSLAPDLTVMENILLGIEPTWGPFVRWGQLRKQAGDALQAVGLETIDPATPLKRLSIAQQQLVEIARAVAIDCRVLVLDEPTSSLTQSDIAQLFQLIRELSSQGISVIYISHFLEEVAEISQRITVLRDGESVGTRVTADVEPAEIVALMVGRDVAELYPRSNRSNDGEVVLEVNQLAGDLLPRDASLKLRRGSVLGIAGLVGSGRTELMRAIFGLDNIIRGDVTIAHVGDVSASSSPAARWRQHVGMVSEDRKQEGLALNLSIAENITLPKLDGLGPWRLVMPSRQNQASQQWVQQIQIKCTGPQQTVNSLSGGNQQKVAIARLLHADVDILLLDEPTRGIDVGSKAQIYQWIDRLANPDQEADHQPKAILVISSYLPELLGICDEICVMHRGQLSPPRPASQWDERSLMSVATGQSD
ncbi:MAG: sugar ABC transporter ATP-binding protein [Planctomycetota bacterium]